MAVPVVEDTKEWIANTNRTTHSAELPDSYATDGRLLIGFFATTDSGTVTHTIPDGWAQIDQTAESGWQRLTVAYKVASSESSTVDWTTGASVRSCCFTMSISGFLDPATQAPEANAATAGGTANKNLDPPSLSPTGGSKDYLWLAASADDRAGSVTSAWPYNVGNAVEFNNGSNGKIRVDWDATLSARASENPSTWTTDLVARWVATTVAVHPAGGASVAPLAGRHLINMMGN